MDHILTSTALRNSHPYRSDVVASPGEELLSGSNMSARWRQSTSIEETAGSLAMSAMV